MSLRHSLFLSQEGLNYIYIHVLPFINHSGTYKLVKLVTLFVNVLVGPYIGQTHKVLNVNYAKLIGLDLKETLA